ncbi:DNA-binding protein [Burkholderia plantarii]|uniref:DNA-binding protein n=1 Tax=Burkholderia plantarii TaxID=41899 RepID=UPI00087083C7|nr:DNA-binding protein [Burkholderia plantarii]
MSEIVFKSAFDAVRFALCYSSQQYGETILAKHVDASKKGSGMGLVGLDGAAQVGMIRREIESLSELHLAVIVARAAPRQLPCDCGRPCCSHWRPNGEWQAAVAWLTDASMAHCSGCSHYRVRRAIIEKTFGAKVNLVDIAHTCGVHINTVSKHNTTIRKWLDGDQRTGTTGVMQAAWAKLEQRFIEIGLVETNAVT